MSYVIAAPESVSAAATDLANIGSAISSANAAALAPTSDVLAAGADEVSAAVAGLFTAHAEAYQTLSAQAASFHQQFVQLMNAGSAQYAAREAANAAANVSPLQTLRQDLLRRHQCATELLVGRRRDHRVSYSSTPRSAAIADRLTGGVWWIRRYVSV